MVMTPAPHVPPAETPAPVTTAILTIAGLVAAANIALCTGPNDPLTSLAMLAWHAVPVLLAVPAARRLTGTPWVRRITIATVGAMLLVETAFLATTVAQILVQHHGWTIPGVRPESLYGLVPLVIPLPVGGIGLAGLAVAVLVMRLERAALSGAR